MPESRDMNMASRLFKLTDAISRNPKRYTARQLAGLFSVSERTIRRDVQKLEEIGIRVEAETQGGYFIMADLSKMPVMLTMEEEASLKIIPWFLKGMEGNHRLTPLIQAFFAAMEKMSSKLGLSTDLTVDPDKLSERIIVEFSSSDWMPTTEASVVDLFHAMAERLTVEVEYHSYSTNQTTTRLIDPYYLLPRNNSLYVIGFCHLREGYRTFKVSRMRRITLTNKRFVLETDFSLADFLRLAWGIDESGEPVQAVIAFSSEISRYVKEELDPVRILQSWEDEQGRYIVEVQTRLNPEFYRWLLQFGAEAEVISPQSLRERLCEEIQKWGRSYEGYLSGKSGT